MDQSMVDLNHKIDELTTQVSFLTEQAQISERQRADRAELMRDLTPIANEAFRLSVEQLEEIQEYVELSDLLRLVKRVLRNGRNFEKMLNQLESLMDLVNTLGPLTNEAFGKAVESLTELERKGYFTFAQGGMRIMDNVVTSFSEEDVDRLGDNVVLILDTVKEMTQPEIMQLLSSTASVMREEDIPENVSMFYIMRQMNDPAVKRGLAKTLNVLRTVSEN